MANPRIDSYAFLTISLVSVNLTLFVKGPIRAAPTETRRPMMTRTIAISIRVKPRVPGQFFMIVINCITKNSKFIFFIKLFYAFSLHTHKETTVCHSKQSEGI